MSREFDGVESVESMLTPMGYREQRLVAQARADERAMAEHPRYEYRVADCGTGPAATEWLSELGAEGWRVLSAQFTVNPTTGPGWDLILERALPTQKALEDAKDE